MNVRKQLGIHTLTLRVLPLNCQTVIRVLSRVIYNGKWELFFDIISTTTLNHRADYLLKTLEYEKLAILCQLGNRHWWLILCTSSIKEENSRCSDRSAAVRRSLPGILVFDILLISAHCCYSDIEIL